MGEAGIGKCFVEEGAVDSSFKRCVGQGLQTRLQWGPNEIGNWRAPGLSKKAGWFRVARSVHFQETLCFSWDVLGLVSNRCPIKNSLSSHMTRNPEAGCSMVCSTDLHHQGSGLACVSLPTTPPEGCRMASVAPGIILCSHKTAVFKAERINKGEG